MTTTHKQSSQESLPSRQFILYYGLQLHWHLYEIFRRHYGLDWSR